MSLQCHLDIQNTYACRFECRLGSAFEDQIIVWFTSTIDAYPTVTVENSNKAIHLQTQILTSGHRCHCAHLGCRAWCRQDHRGRRTGVFSLVVGGSNLGKQTVASAGRWTATADGQTVTSASGRRPRAGRRWPQRADGNLDERTATSAGGWTTTSAGSRWAGRRRPPKGQQMVSSSGRTRRQLPVSLDFCLWGGRAWIFSSALSSYANCANCVVPLPLLLDAISPCTVTLQESFFANAYRYWS
jgi:hypothetical protein